MNSKQVKKLRKEIKRAQIGSFKEFAETIDEAPLKLRLKIIFKIILRTSTFVNSFSPCRAPKKETKKTDYSSQNACSIVDVGENYIKIATPDNHPSDGNGYCPSGITLKEYCPQLKVGDIVKVKVISVDTERKRRK